MINLENNSTFAGALSEFVDKSDVMSAKALGRISAQITKKRAELGMNQSRFADYMNVSQAMISKWESGDYNFTITTIAQIFAKLNLYFEISVERDDVLPQYKKDCVYKINGYEQPTDLYEDDWHELANAS